MKANVIYYNSFSLYFEIVSCIVTKIAYLNGFGYGNIRDPTLKWKNIRHDLKSLNI